VSSHCSPPKGPEIWGDYSGKGCSTRKSSHTLAGRTQGSLMSIYNEESGFENMTRALREQRLWSALDCSSFLCP
jgi:hypothetical protein